jgi:hypothetical protein
MKRQLILSLAIVFTLALFAPAISYAFESAPIVTLDNKEKKAEPKVTTTVPAEQKAEAATTGTKPCCNKEMKAGCCKEQKAGCCKDSGKSETKACTGEKKADFPLQKKTK